MKRLNFSATGIESIFEELHKPIVGISTQKIASDVIIALIFWHQDGTGVRCRSNMHDVAPRIELGVLDFAKIRSNRDKECEGFLDGGLPSFDTLEVLLMTIEAGGVVAESGMVLRSASSRIMVACGAAPYSLAVYDSRFPDRDFLPEYKISEYKEEPMQSTNI